MQYGVTADTGVPGWVKWYDVVPLSEVDATHEAVANNTGAFDAYWPTYFFADTLGIFTASKQICLRMAINHASAEASSLKLTMHTIEDNHQTAEFHVITKPVYPGE
jgi:hypothetical protein